MRFMGSRIRKAIILLSILFGSAPGVTLAGSASMQDEYKPPTNVTVILERIYLDGEISEEVVNEKYWSPENFWAKYDQWQLTEMNDSTYVFKRRVDDISPLLKSNGYFGITNDGVLTIFNGKPGQSRIIQSFFQLDINKLESKKQEELIQGIPIKNKDRFVEVLETFKPYSME